MRCSVIPAFGLHERSSSLKSKFVRREGERVRERFLSPRWGWILPFVPPLRGWTWEGLGPPISARFSSHARFKARASFVALGGTAEKPCPSRNCAGEVFCRLRTKAAGKSARSTPCSTPPRGVLLPAISWLCFGVSRPLNSWFVLPIGTWEGFFFRAYHRTIRGIDC
jgi:hypothetical protein